MPGREKKEEVFSGRLVLLLLLKGGSPFLLLARSWLHTQFPSFFLSLSLSLSFAPLLVTKGNVKSKRRSAWFFTIVVVVVAVLLLLSDLNSFIDSYLAKKKKKKKKEEEVLDEHFLFASATHQRHARIEWWHHSSLTPDPSRPVHNMQNDKKKLLEPVDGTCTSSQLSVHPIHHLFLLLLFLILLETGRPFNSVKQWKRKKEKINQLTLASK